MSNRRRLDKLILPSDERKVETAPADLVVVGGAPKRCEMMLPPDDRLCGRPAHYIFELARSEWAKAKTDKPLIGHACKDHGKEARTMPGLMWIKSL